MFYTQQTFLHFLHYHSYTIFFSIQIFKGQADKHYQHIRNQNNTGLLMM